MTRKMPFLLAALSLMACSPSAMQFRAAASESGGALTPLHRQGDKLDPGHVMLPAYPRPMPEGREWTMAFESLENGRICFLRQEKSFKDKDDEPDESAKDLPDYAVEAHDALPASDRPIFPAGPHAGFDSFEFLGKKGISVKVPNKPGEPDRGRLDMTALTMRMCGKAPAITAKTRYLSVSHKGLAPFGSNPDIPPEVLLIWEIHDL